MKKNFLKIIGIIIVAIILVFSFFYDSYPKKDDSSQKLKTATQTPTKTVPAISEEEEKTVEETENIIEKKEIVPKKENKALIAEVPKKEETVTTEAQLTQEKNDSVYCTLSVECNTIYDNISDFPEEKLSLLPSDGIILSASEIEFKEGESVFDVLKRELTERKIHFEFSTAAYNSAYIEGINNIYEFDCGELSGWIYSVNGVFPQYSCSDYKLKNNDVVKVMFSCSLGQDVGKN